MINCQALTLFTAKASMIIEGAQLVPLNLRVRTAVLSFARASAIIQYAHQGPRMRQFTPVSSVALSAIGEPDAIRRDPRQFSRLVRCVGMIAFIAQIAIARQVMITIGAVRFVPITEVRTTACLALVAVSVAIASVGMKVRQGLRLVTHGTSLVWYTVHVNLLQRLAAPRVLLAPRGFLLS